jgi:hypothetical protein
MADDIPSEEEVLDELLADEDEDHLDELEDELPAFEREQQKIEDKTKRERGE